MSQPRVHTWTFAAATSEGKVVTLRAYLADEPLVISFGEHESDEANHSVVVTCDGEPVERVEQGVYTLIPSGTMVSSSDPKAP